MGEMCIGKVVQYYFYIGEYQKVLSVLNEVVLEWGFDIFIVDDRRYFEGFMLVSVVIVIIDWVKDEQIVIFNEVYYKLIYWVFIKKLLKGLFNSGYRYFGLEVFFNCDYVLSEFCDSLLNERGYFYI